MSQKISRRPTPTATKFKKNTSTTLLKQMRETVKSSTQPTPKKKVSTAKVLPPSEEPVEVEAAGIKTTSELASLLQKAGIATLLAEPPKLFAAVLSKKNSNQTHSEIFSVQSHGEGSVHTVLAKLVSTVTGKKVAKAEHTPCGLEFFLKRQFEVLGNENTVISGEDVAFNGNNLGAGVRIQIFRNNPHILDSDPATLKTNKAIAKEALERALEESKETGTMEEHYLKLKQAITTDYQEQVKEGIRNL